VNARPTPPATAASLRDAPRTACCSIVEQKDATAARAGACAKANTGVTGARRPKPAEAAGSAALRSANAQGEYYLTDVIAMARQATAARVVPLAAARESPKCSASTTSCSSPQLEGAYRARLRRGG
jgi:bifunctional UDP-N-acetylglucosamine pyrophosphorylase/glucosamine-1-phosphate N-acetyltransferase